MKLSQYTQREGRIVSSDSDGIRERWLWGLRLLADTEKIAPAGGLRHGVIDALIHAATKRGYGLSEREIRRRLQCARTYPTEVQIGQAMADFECWSDLANANFPGYPGAVSEPAADWRTDAEKNHDRARAWLDMTNGMDAMFPLSSFEPVETTLEDLETYMKEQLQINENFAATYTKRRTYLDQLEEAAEHDLSVTWQQAHERLGGESPTASA